MEKADSLRLLERSRRGNCVIVGHLTARRRGVERCESAFASLGSSPIADHSQRDREYPRLETGTSFELGKPAMNDEEDVLHHVVDRCFGHPEPAHAPPNEVEKLTIYFLE